MSPEPRAAPAALWTPESCLCCASEVGAAWTRAKCLVRPCGRAEPGCTAAGTPGARRRARSDQLWGSCLPHTGVNAGLGRWCRRCVGAGRCGEIGRLWGAGCGGSGPDLGVWTPPLVPTVPSLSAAGSAEAPGALSPHSYDWREGRRLGGGSYFGAKTPSALRPTPRPTLHVW